MPETGCPGVLPQELWNHTISFLHGRTLDLQTCCRVSRALCAAAQSQLFHSVAIHPSRNFLRRIGRPLIFTLNEVGLCRRLRAILTESPHIIRYLRRIEITLQEDVIAEILAMELVPLESIQFRTETFLAEVDDRAVELAQTLLHRSGIEHLELRSISQRPAFLTRLCSPSMPQLNTLDISMSELQLNGLEEGDGAPSSASLRKKITDLRLVHSPTIARWLLDADCPFDLTALTHADVSSSMCPEVAQILKTASGTLRHLTLAPGDVLSDSCVDLRLIPRLTHLNLDAPTERDILVALPLLETLDPVNAVREITLTLAQHGEKLTPEELAGVRRDFEARFADITLPSLQSLDIRSVGKSE
ncbi:hypothetical protein B0H11DRAFT_1949213 [Mycena galericulata]|nr:hypothetical protein B0H11DRAFT_1949213 [Mycena galericulata]